MFMSRIGDFRSPHLLLCHHCIYVVNPFFLLSSRWCDVHDFFSVVGERACFVSFRSQIRVGLNYSSSRFIHILLRQR